MFWKLVKALVGYAPCDKCGKRSWLRRVVYTRGTVTVYLGQKFSRVEKTSYKGYVCETCDKALRESFRDPELEAMFREIFSDPAFKEMEKELDR